MALGTARGFLRFDEGDPQHSSDSSSGKVRYLSTGRKLHDPSVTFEEYLFWAKYTRADERYEDTTHDYTLFGLTLKKGSRGSAVDQLQMAPDVGRAGKATPHHEVGRLNVTDAEWVTASRAVRTASWGAVFYLITTDILGPFGNPYAFAAMGYGPGSALFTIFGIMAAYGGFMLWRMFLALDSDRYPLRTYADIAFRVYGPMARYCVNGLQSIQLLFNVGIIIVMAGLAMEQIITGSGRQSVCFVILCFIWVLLGMLAGQIRSLRNIGYLAHLAVWMNVFTMILTMAVVPSTGIQAEAAIAANAQFHIKPGDPIRTSVGAMPGTDFSVQVNGLGQAVYAYGGAMLFVEFMAEMRRPFDFWKGMICAQSFIYVVYMFFGLWVYSYQGQYALNPATNGIGSYAWQTVANSLTLAAIIIAALLYGNIGMKVVYNNVLMDLLNFPSLSTRAGQIAWVACIPAYWAVAFVLAAAIPQVTNLSSLIASACIVQFSYTFPPWMMIGYMCKKNAMLDADGYHPTTGCTVRADAGYQRWLRGFMKNPFFNSFNVVYLLGTSCCAVIGVVSAVIGIRTQYATGVGTSFSCNNPYSS